MKSNLNKISKSVIAVYAIIIFIYILAFLLIPFDKTEASWIEFIFTIIAFIVSLIVFRSAFLANKTIVSKIYGYPIFRIGAIYAITQLFVGIVICIISAIISVPYWISLLISILLFGVAIIGVIITDNTRDIVESVDNSTKTDTEKMYSFQTIIGVIVETCEESTLKIELEKLKEMFRYSDPVSNEKTKSKEMYIEAMLTELRELINNGDYENIKEMIKKISQQLNERNYICKLSKE